MGAAQGQAVGAKLYGLGAVILEPQHHKAVLRIDGDPDQLLLRVRLGGHALGGVVQRGAHNGADLAGGKEIQQLAVGHTGHIDAVLLAVQAFGGQQRVQNRVAGLVLGLVTADVAFHGGEGGVLLGLVTLGTDGGDLHLQLVVAPVDELDVLLALTVLLILAAQYVVHG